MTITKAQKEEIIRIIREYIGMKEVDDFDMLVIPKVKAAQKLLESIETED